jgi:hypothetical protein
MTQLPLLGTAPDLAALRSRAAVLACEGEVEVYVAGVDACFAVTAGAGVQDILGFALVPSSDAIYADLGFPWDRAPDDIDPQRDGVRVMEVARAHASAFDCGVGAFAQLTTVTRDAITTRIVHRWPDHIGDIIGA